MGDGMYQDEALGELARHPSRGSARIHKGVLVDLLRRGLNQAQAAEFFAVSEAAVSKARAKLQVHIDRDVATGQAAAKLLDANLLSGARLVALAERCESLIDLCNTVVFAGNEFAPEVMEAKGRLRRLVGSKGNVGATVVALLGEARKQLEFVHTIQRDVYNLKGVQEFQEVILKAIGEESPELQRRIMAKLEQVQAVRQSLEFSSTAAGPVGSLDR